MKRQLILGILGAALAAHAAPPLVECFELSRVRLLDSPFKDLQELHRKGLVGHLEPDKLLFGFRKTAGLPQPSGVTGGYGGWDAGFIAGHYGGHYLSAAARMFDLVNRQEVLSRLAPLHRVHHQRFAVWWKVVAPGRQ